MLAGRSHSAHLDRACRIGALFEREVGDWRRRKTQSIDMRIANYSNHLKCMIARSRLVADEMPDRILLAEEPLCECLVEDGHRLRMRPVGVAEYSSSQQRNAHGVEVIDTDVVLFSMHLRGRKVRLAGNVDGRIPDAARARGTSAWRHRERKGNDLIRSRMR